MLSTLKEKLLLPLLALGGLVLGLLAYFRGKKVNQLEAELVVSNHDKTDTVLSNDQANIEAKIAEVVKQAEDARNQTVTPEELAKQLDKI